LVPFKQSNKKCCHGNARAIAIHFKTFKKKLGRWGKDCPHDITLIEELNRSPAEKGHESWLANTRMPPPAVRSLTCALRPNPRVPYMRARPPQVVSLMETWRLASDLFLPQPVNLFLLRIKPGTLGVLREHLNR
jgi:hypothetical protein